MGCIQSFVQTVYIAKVVLLNFIPFNVTITVLYRINFVCAGLLQKKEKEIFQLYTQKRVLERKNGSILALHTFLIQFSKECIFVISSFYDE